MTSPEIRQKGKSDNVQIPENSFTPDHKTPDRLIDSKRNIVRATSDTHYGAMNESAIAGDAGVAQGACMVTRRVRLAATVLCAVTVAGMVVGWALRETGYLRQLIGAASTAYLAIAIAGPAHMGKYGRWLTVGLVFCWLGDMLGPKSFITGVVLFLLAHVAFIAAFIVGGLRKTRVLASAALSVLIGVSLALWIVPHVPVQQRTLIVAYTVLVSAMLAAGGAVTPVGSRSLVPWAAGLFYISDFCLAQTAFMGGGVSWTIVGYPMYYTACMLFAWSVGKH